MLLPAPGGAGKEGWGNLWGLSIWEAFPLHRLLPFENYPGDEAESIGQERREASAGRDKRKTDRGMYQWR